MRIINVTNMVQVNTSGEASGRAKIAEFRIGLQSVDYDEQDVDDFEEYAEVNVEGSEILVAFRFHELPLYAIFNINENTLYVTNAADVCRYRSDFLMHCIVGTFVVCGWALAVFILYVLS